MPRRIRRPVYIMNIKTREIKHFLSVADCGRFIGIGVTNMNSVLQPGRQHVPCMGYYIKYADDLTPWPDKDYIYKKPVRTEIPVVLTHIETGKKEFFPNMQSAGIKIGCNCATISYVLKKAEPYPYKGYLIHKAEPSYSNEFQINKI